MHPFSYSLTLPPFVLFPQFLIVCLSLIGLTWSYLPFLGCKSLCVPLFASLSSSMLCLPFSVFSLVFPVFPCAPCVVALVFWNLFLDFGFVRLFWGPLPSLCNTTIDASFQAEAIFPDSIFLVSFLLFLSLKNTMMGPLIYCRLWCTPINKQ